MIALLSGLIAGAGHVLAGPDHLTAVAPLAAHRPQRAWLPGLRWGIGHSAGVVLIGLLFLLFRDLIPVAWLSSWGERLVGFLLIGVGVWGLRQAARHHVHAHEHTHDGETHVHIHVHAVKHGHDQPGAHRHTHAALGIGMLHGLAGSSHLLGVLPMLALPTHLMAVTYLAAFAVGTVVAMTGFTWAVGWAARRCAARGARLYRGLLVTCGVAAIVVGFVWIGQAFAGAPEVAG